MFISSVASGERRLAVETQAETWVGIGKPAHASGFVYQYTLQFPFDDNEFRPSSSAVISSTLTPLTESQFSQCITAVCHAVQHKYRRLFLLPSRKRTLNYAAQHNFRRLLLVPSRKRTSNYAVQHNFRRLLLVPSMEIIFEICGTVYLQAYVTSVI